MGHEFHKEENAYKETKEKEYHEQGHVGGFSKNIREKNLLNNRILQSETTLDCLFMLHQLNLNYKETGLYLR